MTYTHLTTDELVLIEAYYHQNKKGTYVAKQLKRAKQTIYNVYKGFDNEFYALDYYKRYKDNKKIAAGVLFIYVMIDYLNIWISTTLTNLLLNQLHQKAIIFQEKN